MSTALHYLDAGLVAAAFAGMFWWAYVQLTKANTQRELELTSRRAAIQPWGNDKPSGRGNR